MDDHFWSHPKTGDLSDSATALWLRAGSWSAGHLTDGFIPESKLRFFRGRQRSATELVDAGLWSAVEGGFVFHDWAEYQPSREAVTARRDATKTRVNTWREGRRNGVTDATREHIGNAPPDPTRPDPTRPTSKEVKNTTEAKASRGARIPEPFIVTAAMREWAAGEVPTVDVDAATRSFVDYWRGVSGARGTKLDWAATWRNSLRMTAKRETVGVKLTPEARARQTLALVADEPELRGIGA